MTYKTPRHAGGEADEKACRIEVIFRKRRKARRNPSAKRSNNKGCTRTGGGFGATTARVYCGYAASWSSTAARNCSETGVIRRYRLRLQENNWKRHSVHVDALNLGLILRQLPGASSPQNMSDESEVVLRKPHLGVGGLVFARSPSPKWPACRSPILSLGS